MKKLKMSWVYLGFALFLGFTVCSFDLLAVEKSPEQKVDRKAIEKGLQDSFGMPVLTGELWHKMDHDSKVAFIWGFGHAVTIEHHVMEKYPELKRDSFVPKVVEGMAKIPMNDIVTKIDMYYSSNPDHIDDPVTKVIWVTMIKPNIKTGIAGRPLSN